MTTQSQSNAATHYQQWPDKAKNMHTQAPDLSAGFGGMFKKLMGEGALSIREKELIALAIGMALRCEPCIYSHVEKCVKAGATRAQIIELAGVVVTMQGGPGYVYTPKLIEALDALGVD
ncbi:MAG: carboxymuconolactone decarboxylase family protein [Phycisphaerales bacterium]|nr:carboxymuconolactone decarboxylase family protein [Phycisphaerales bacterium]